MLGMTDWKSVQHAVAHCKYSNVLRDGSQKGEPVSKSNLSAKSSQLAASVKLG